MNNLTIDHERTEIIAVDGTPTIYTQTAMRDAQIGQMADEAAARAVFSDYTSRKAKNTLKAQRRDLERFTDYLAMIQIERTADALHSDPDAWAFVSMGIVEGFVKWQLGEGAAIGSINRSLSTVKKFTALATKAGRVTVEANAMIRLVSGYSSEEAKRVNEKRTQTRTGAKKEEHTSIPADKVDALKTAHKDDPRGRRDRLLMSLLIDLGLRAGEAAGLKVGDFDRAAGTVTFYREKVSKTQTHNLTPDILAALGAWIDSGDCPKDNDAPILLGATKSGTLTRSGMSSNAVSMRVKRIGSGHGIEGLSAHDCRHYWATEAVRNGASAFALRDAGGWSSLAMPSLYVERAAIANAEIVPGTDSE